MIFFFWLKKKSLTARVMKLVIFNVAVFFQYFLIRTTRIETCLTNSSLESDLFIYLLLLFFFTSIACGNSLHVIFNATLTFFYQGKHKTYFLKFVSVTYFVSRVLKLVIESFIYLQRSNLIFTPLWTKIITLSSHFHYNSMQLSNSAWLFFLLVCIQQESNL